MFARRAANQSPALRGTGSLTESSVRAVAVLTAIAGARAWCARYGRVVLRVLASPSSGGQDGNPYIDLLYDALRVRGVQVEEFDRKSLLTRPDVIHVHWPDFLVRWGAPPVAVLDVVKVLSLLAWARVRGARLVWTGHDLRPHDSVRPRLYSLYHRVFIRLVDVVISLGDSATGELLRTYPRLRKVPTVVVEHGHYRSVVEPLPDRARARAAVGLPEAGRTALLLGQVRPYKNVPQLVRASVERETLGLGLAVVGEVRGDDGLTQDVEQAARGGEVVLALRRVPAGDVGLWHAACDVVVLPYALRSALHSGAAVMALSCSRPAVVAASDTMRELQHLVGEEWLQLCDGPPARFLEQAAAFVDVPRSAGPDLSALDWGPLADRTLAAYELALARRR